MRIQHLYISEYKNLKNFNLNFDGTSFIDVFVGKNGTGKSNLFEALIEIFRHLYENDYKEIKFDYKLQYIIEEKGVQINWNWIEEKWVDDTGKEVKKVTKDRLPDNILIYYSGHNSKVTNLVDEYEDKFKKTLKVANQGDTREFFGIGKNYKSLLLSVLLIQNDQNKAKQHIIERLGIKELGTELKITLHRPEYARGKDSYNIDQFVPKDRFWGAEGITSAFLDKLSSVKRGENIGKKVRDEGFQPLEDEYILFYDITDFQRVFSDETAQSIFRDFDNLKTIGMLADISIEIKLQDGTKINVQQFSDGQFQSIYIYSIIELFKDRNCITLLDEPDSFLHPEWQFDFLKQVVEITEATAVNNHVLMTSHSASTIASSNEAHLNLFTLDGNSINVSKIGKNKIIKDLSRGLLTLSNDETIMSINTYLKNTTQPVLFTEGISDEFILDIAWKKLYPDEKRPFCIHNAFDRIFLRNLFSREELKTNNPHRTFFALFDFDEAYDDWNGLSKKGDEIITDPFKGLIRKLKNVQHYAMLLPVPNVESIRKQVLNADNQPWGKGSESHLSIELLFYRDENNDPNFRLDDISGGGQLIKFIGGKIDFAKNVIPNLPVEYFEILRPMFELIKATINTNVGA